MTIENFTPLTGLLGGVLIGLSVSILLWLNGRIAGISGIVGGLLGDVNKDTVWRLLFVLGMLAGVLVWSAANGQLLRVDVQDNWLLLIIAGFLVGFGTRLGGGCTSGHGIAGLARLSKRSLVATAVFMGFGIATVFVVRHIIG